MTIKTRSAYGHKGTYEIAGKGQECRIDVAVGNTRSYYDDKINILTHHGDVWISGNHVHELMKSILRFSSPKMLETWIRFALLTNKADGRKDIDLASDYFDLCEWDINAEKFDRNRELEWNNKYFSVKRGSHEE